MRGGSIQRHAGFDFGVGERDAVQSQGQISELIFFDEKSFVEQAQFAAKPDAAAQPDLDSAPDRQVQFSRRLVGRHLPDGDPMGVACVGADGLEIEFALELHGEMIGRIRGNAKCKMQNEEWNEGTAAGKFWQGMGRRCGARGGGGHYSWRFMAVNCPGKDWKAAAKIAVEPGNGPGRAKGGSGQNPGVRREKEEEWGDGACVVHEIVQKSNI